MTGHRIQPPELPRKEYRTRWTGAADQHARIVEVSPQNMDDVHGVGGSRSTTPRYSPLGVSEAYGGLYAVHEYARVA